MHAGEKTWFRAGKGGIGHLPQTWQGWVSIAAFISALITSVEIVQALAGDTARGQSVAFVVAAIEIMAFLSFVRKRSQASGVETPKK